MLVLYGCLGGGEACDRYAERAAGCVVHADTGAELNGAWLTTVLAADTCTESRTNGTTFLYCHLDQLTYAVLIQYLERIDFEDLLLEVYREEGSDIVTAVTEGHLRQVVGTEGEVLSLGSDTVCGQRGTRDLDHRTDLELYLYAVLSEDLFRYALDDLFLLLELIEDTDERHHDLRHRVLALFLEFASGTEDSAGLHRGDLREGDTQTATTVTEHRVVLQPR